VKPELNREYKEPNEDQIFDQMVKLTGDEMKRKGANLREQHGKTTGCVTAEFRIAENIPSHLRYGVFEQSGRVFKAIVRFSNRRNPNEGKDSKGQARGLAIKLLDVDGKRALDYDTERTQDFLMVDLPAFLFPTPKVYLRGSKWLNWVARKISSHNDLVNGLTVLISAGWNAFRIVLRVSKKVIASPLHITYWSCTPYRLGPETSGHAVKYTAVPSKAPGTPEPSRPENPGENYLTDELKKELAVQDAVFDFKVIWQTDPVTMPVENVQVQWAETESNTFTVATLRIPRHLVDPFGKACESMSFTPWHALEAHRPIGGMNRLRKRVYEESLRIRTNPPTGQHARAAESVASRV
jgi:hypothetical protein